jgi:adenylate kinase family enzyme
MIILIMGLLGSGKTTLAKELYKRLDDCDWFNADEVTLLTGQLNLKLL